MTAFPPVSAILNERQRELALDPRSYQSRRRVATDGKRRLEMTVSCSSLLPWRRAMRTATSIVTLAAAWTVVAHAQIQDFALGETTSPPPYVLFQYSTLTGSGNTV